MFAVSLALIAQEFAPGRERGTAMGIYGATIGVAVAVGPLVGGALTDGLGWESIFLLNVPIGIAALALTCLRVRESRDPHATRIDGAGVVTFSAALFLLVLALVRGNDEGWGSALIVGLLGGAAALLAAFVAVETRGPRADAAARAVPAAGLHRRPARRVRGLGLDLRPLPLPDALPAERARPDRRSRPGCATCRSRVASFVAAPVAGALLSRVPARLMLAAGLAGGRRRAAADGAASTRATDWTTLLAGFIVAGARRRAASTR